MNLKNISDTDLLAMSKSYSVREKEVLLIVLRHIADVELRELYLSEGYHSMYSYLIIELGYSENGASRRLRGARLINLYPETFDMIKDGSLNLSTVSEALKVITPENKAEVLGAVAGKNIAEAKAFVAKLRPEKAKKSSIREVHVKKEEHAPDMFSKQQSDKHYQIAAKPEKRFEFRFQASEDFMTEFNEVRRLLSGKYPRGIESEAVFREVMAYYIKGRSPKARAERRNGREAKPSLAKGVTPAIRDAVLVRDGERCTHVSSGKRCDCTWDLEVDHIVPKALG